MLLRKSKANEILNIGNHTYSSYLTFLMHNNWRRKSTLSLQHACHLTPIIPAVVIILSIRNRTHQLRYHIRTGNVDTSRSLPAKDWYRSELGSGMFGMATKGGFVSQDFRLEQPFLSKCGVLCIMLYMFCARLASCDCNERRWIIQA